MSKFWCRFTCIYAHRRKHKTKMLKNQEEEQWTSASFFCNSSHNHDVVYVIKYHIQLSAYLYTKNVLIDTYINTRKYLLRLGSQKNIKRVGNFNRPLKNSATLYSIKKNTNWCTSSSHFQWHRSLSCSDIV